MRREREWGVGSEEMSLLWMLFYGGFDLRVGGWGLHSANVTVAVLRETEKNRAERESLLSGGDSGDW